MQWKHCALTAILAVVSAPALAQTTLHENDFEGRRPALQNNGLWSVDGTPSSVPGGAASSGNKSLNFNNGTNYAGTSRGAVSSPAISVPAGESLRLQFSCNYETETTGTQWDKRSVVIRLNSSVQQTIQLASGRRIPRDRRCAAMGTWHQHTITVPTHTAASDMHVEFVFDSVDDYANDHAGWFIDDFQLVWPNGTPASAFNSVKNTSVDFRQYSVSVEVLPDKSVTVLQSSPTARYAPITGRATDAEFRALTDAVQRGRLASVPSVIHDPRTFIVAPTTFRLEVDSPVSTHHNTIGGNLGWYDQWDAQVRPVMDALLAIQTRLLTPQPTQPFNSVKNTSQNFRQYSVSTEVLADKSVNVLQGSPTALYAPVTGTATDAELQALSDAVQAGALGSIPATIPDPNTYIVAPTTFRLEVRSAVSSNDNTISGSLGIYDQWDSQIRPVMDALKAIQDRLLGTTPPPPSDDHGNTIQTATQLDPNPNVPATNGSIDPAGDVDFFLVADIVPMIAIYPPPVSDYTFETTVIGNMDTYVDLYAADGTHLASNDDGGQGLASRVTYRGVRGTPVFAKVRHYSANGTGDYTIRVTSTPVSPPPMPPGDDHGDTGATATTIDLGGPAADGSIEVADDVDMFQFNQIVIAIYPPPTFTYVAETTVNGNMDTVIDFIGMDGTTVLATNDDAPGLGYASKIVFTAQAGTVRYIRVRHYSSSNSGTGTYTVRVYTQ